MWTKPPPEVSCVSSSVESFYRGATAGGIFGLVFAPEGVGAIARLGSPLRPALLAGSWCFLTSFASCVLTRGGFGWPWNGTFSGLFSGAVIGLASRWPPESIAWTMASSSLLSIMSHYATEGQKDGVQAESRRCAGPTEAWQGTSRPVE
ncbi:unnamed protein product [Polarella glacialis]|uniref:Uncharacterized protein n=1 Tax=Polarella glacialis TaxID=89957 RepID=A0A813GLH0_POLGL|nr:unnamed protein product [Polarella glacialis]CAE8728751.1 unnamed protein product [Polarella glacialis]